MTIGAYFIWKSLNSADDMGIIVTKLPAVEKPEKNVEEIIIPGRDGSLTVDDGTYATTTKPVECALDHGDIDALCAWLTGSGFVTFSNEPDKQYMAKIINSVPLKEIIPTFRTFIIQFSCQPKKYSIENDLITIDTSPAMISHPGTENAKPVIKVYGTGTIDITINSTVVHMKNVVDYVTIDSSIMDAYKDTELKNSDMYGEFPEFVPGTNNISWTGTVTQIEILPNWRWL
ncbi:MAG: phage tail protein [Anaerofustis sp.]